MQILIELPRDFHFTQQKKGRKSSIIYGRLLMGARILKNLAFCCRQLSPNAIIIHKCSTSIANHNDLFDNFLLSLNKFK